MYTTSLKSLKGRPAHNALSEHLLQGSGLLLLMEKPARGPRPQTHFETDRACSAPSTASASACRAAGTVGLVGESGCGRAMTSLSVMGLVPRSAGQSARREAVIFASRDVLRLSADEPPAGCPRAGKMSMIFQEPMTSLNPVHTIGQQIVEGDPRPHHDVATGRDKRARSKCSNW